MVKGNDSFVLKAASATKKSLFYFNFFLMFHFIFKNFKKINLQTSTDEVLASACYGGAAINLNIILIFSNYL
jgi:hypothetical protein